MTPEDDNRRNSSGTPVSLDELRAMNKSWSLASDSKLLELMKHISHDVFRQTHSISNSMNQLLSVTKGLQCQINNITNEFTLISTSQFMENRVDDSEDVPVASSNVSNSINNKEKPKAMLEANYVEQAKSAFQVSLSILEEAFTTIEIKPNIESDDEDAAELSKISKILVEPKDRYGFRPLPHLIGSSEFLLDNTLGLLEEKEEGEVSILEPDEENTAFTPAAGSEEAKGIRVSASSSSNDLMEGARGSRPSVKPVLETSSSMSKKDARGASPATAMIGTAKDVPPSSSVLAGSKPEITITTEESPRILPVATGPVGQPGQAKLPSFSQSDNDLFSDEDSDLLLSVGKRPSFRNMSTRNLFEDDDEDSQPSLFVDRGPPREVNNEGSDLQPTIQQTESPMAKVSGPGIGQQGEKSKAKTTSTAVRDLFDDQDDDGLFGPPTTLPSGKSSLKATPSQQSKKIDPTPGVSSSAATTAETMKSVPNPMAGVAASAPRVEVDLFSDDTDLFGDIISGSWQQKSSNSQAVKPGLFDESAGLPSTTVLPPSQNKSAVPKNPPKTLHLFDDNEDDDVGGLFSKGTTFLQRDKSAVDKVSGESAKVHPPSKFPGLFGAEEEDGDELFSSSSVSSPSTSSSLPQAKKEATKPERKAVPDLFNADLDSDDGSLFQTSTKPRPTESNKLKTSPASSSKSTSVDAPKAEPSLLFGDSDDGRGSVFGTPVSSPSKAAVPALPAAMKGTEKGKLELNDTRQELEGDPFKKTEALKKDTPKESSTKRNALSLFESDDEDFFSKIEDALSTKRNGLGDGGRSSSQAVDSSGTQSEGRQALSKAISAEDGDGRPIFTVSNFKERPIAQSFDSEEDSSVSKVTLSTEDGPVPKVATSSGDEPITETSTLTTTLPVASQTVFPDNHPAASSQASLPGDAAAIRESPRKPRMGVGLMSSSIMGEMLTKGLLKSVQTKQMSGSSPPNEAPSNASPDGEGMRSSGVFKPEDHIAQGSLLSNVPRVAPLACILSESGDNSAMPSAQLSCITKGRARGDNKRRAPTRLRHHIEGGDVSISTTITSPVQVQEGLTPVPDRGPEPAMNPLANATPETDNSPLNQLPPQNVKSRAGASDPRMAFLGGLQQKLNQSLKTEKAVDVKDQGSNEPGSFTTSEPVVTLKKETSGYTPPQSSTSVSSPSTTPAARETVSLTPSSGPLAAKAVAASLLFGGSDDEEDWNFSSSGQATRNTTSASTRGPDIGTIPKTSGSTTSVSTPKKSLSLFGEDDDDDLFTPKTSTGPTKKPSQPSSSKGTSSINEISDDASIFADKSHGVGSTPKPLVSKAQPKKATSLVEDDPLGFFK